ncbi:MAG: hypothetical protein ACJAWS_001717 [Oleiphilaceae bacterium]
MLIKKIQDVLTIGFKQHSLLPVVGLINKQGAFSA